MKKIAAILAVALLPLCLSAQKEFNKFIDSKDIGTVVINKELLNMVAKFTPDDDNEEAQEFVEMAKNIEGIKVFMTSRASASEEIQQTVKSYLKKSKMDMLMQVKEKDTKVDFYVKSTKNDAVVNELLMLVRGDINKTGAETILVTMKGKIALDKLGTLVNKMNLPEELGKAGEKGK